MNEEELAARLLTALESIEIAISSPKPKSSLDVWWEAYVVVFQSAATRGREVSLPNCAVIATEMMTDYAKKERELCGG